MIKISSLFFAIRAISKIKTVWCFHHLSKEETEVWLNLFHARLNLSQCGQLLSLLKHVICGVPLLVAGFFTIALVLFSMRITTKLFYVIFCKSLRMGPTKWPQVVKKGAPSMSAYSYFEKGCRKKCTRQSRKVL